jgi:hypothetical protein
MADFAEAPIYERLARIGKALASPVRLRARAGHGGGGAGHRVRTGPAA